MLYRAVSNAPPDNYSSWTYDAIAVLSTAINKAGSTEPDKIRAAILSTKGYKGAEGEFNFDEFGDGLHGYNIVRNEKETRSSRNTSSSRTDRHPAALSSDKRVRDSYMAGGKSRRRDDLRRTAGLR